MSQHSSHLSSAKPMQSIVSLLLLCCCLLTSGCHRIPYAQKDMPTADPNAGMYSSPLFLASAKRDFAAQATEKYWNQNPDAALLSDTETIDELILEAARLITPKRTEIHKQLEAYGIYAMPYEQGIQVDLTDAETITIPVENYTDSVYLMPPTIYYQVPTDQWIVAFGGTWINDDWKSGKGWSKEIGGLDSFGINIEDNGQYPGMICTHVCGALYDTGKYANIQSLSAYDSDGTPKAVTTGNRSNGVTADGYGFQLQDQVESEFPFLKTTYLGYQWAGLCVYSTEFADLDATLTAYYIHTYGEKTNGYELPLGQDNALDGVPVDGITGEPIDTTDGYFVRYSRDVVLSPAP